MTPFEAVYGQKPPSVLAYLPGTSKVQVVDQTLISIAISYITSVYCEDYAGYFTVIFPFLAFYFYSAYFIYLVSCNHILSQGT
jgi:hypothetical protein